MSDLRTRIAEAMYAALRDQFENGPAYPAPMVTPAVGSDEFTGIALIDGEVSLTAVADAVIRELGLHQELRRELNGMEIARTQYRYITDWIADE
jgi:hypothetical protein